MSANRIAKWDGTEWSPLGSGVSGPGFPSVFALTVFNDLTGPALYAGGQFTMAGGKPSSFIAAWRCEMPETKAAMVPSTTSSNAAHESVQRN